MTDTSCSGCLYNHRGDCIVRIPPWPAQSYPLAAQKCAEYRTWATERHMQERKVQIESTRPGGTFLYEPKPSAVEAKLDRIIELLESLDSRLESIDASTFPEVSDDN